MRLLDLFCGAGGCSVGYRRAGFTEIVGVDSRPMPRYPFDFIQGDALQVLRALADGVFKPPTSRSRHFELADFDAIHASPPCQSYSAALKHLAGEKPMLLGAVRDLLAASGKPWVIENVVGAPMESAAIVCGTGLGLPIRRHRLFEASFFVMGTTCRHNASEINPHRASSRAKAGLDVERRWREGMEVGWMQKDEARQAIPPAYCEFIGRQLIDHIHHKRGGAT